MTVTAERSTLPPVQCAPWCYDGAGHVREIHPDDQYCISDDARMSSPENAWS